MYKFFIIISGLQANLPDEIPIKCLYNYTRDEFTGGIFPDDFKWAIGRVRTSKTKKFKTRKTRLSKEKFGRTLQEFLKFLCLHCQYL